MIKKLLLATTAMFLLTVGPAQAGPLIAGIGAAFSALGAVGSTIAGLAISMGAQWLMSTLFAPETKQRGVKQEMETGGDNPPAFIVGEYCTPGQLAYINVYDGGDNIPNQCLTYVILLSALPVGGLSNWPLINGERCTIDTSQSFNGFHPVVEYIEGGGGGGYCLVKFHDGTQNNVDSWLLDKFGDHPTYPIDADMWWKGCAHVIVQCWYSNRGIWTGVPEFKWTVKGIPLYDPRKDSSVGGSGPQRWDDPSTWSTAPKNPKVFEYNAIRGIRYGGKHVWGGDAEAYRLPLDYWFAAMNACDQNVTKKNGDVINRFEISGEIHFDDDPREIIVEINKSCQGYTTEYGGTYKTWVGGPGLSVATFTDADFVVTEDEDMDPFLPPEETYNTAYATYPDPREKWEMKDAPKYQHADWLAQDGREVILDAQFPMVTEGNQVQRLMRAMVHDSRRQVQHDGVAPPEAYVLEPFDRISYVSEKWGYGGSGKDFLLASKEDLPNCNQAIKLREVNIDDTSWLTEYELDDTVGPIGNVRPGTMALDVTVAADQVDTASGKDKPAILCTWVWGGIDIGVRSIMWELRRVGTTKVIAEGRIRNLADGNRIIAPPVLRFGGHYEIRFVPEPWANRQAAWTGWKAVTCVVLDIPAPPALTRISQLADDGSLNFFIDVSWTPVSGEGTYRVRDVSGASTTYYDAGNNSRRIPVTSGTTHQISVAVVGSDGTLGSWSTATPITVTKKNTAPTAPTGFTVDEGHKRNKLKWAKSPDRDYSHTDIYRSTINAFPGGSPLDSISGTVFIDENIAIGTVYYYFIVHVDRTDNPSSPSASSGAKAAKAVLAADTDQAALSAPTGLTLALNYQAVDAGDGAVATSYKATWLAVSGSVRYELEVGVSDTSGGAYVVVENIVTTALLASFKVVAGKFYKVRIRAFNAFGKDGTWSAAVGPVSPSAKSSAPAKPTGVVFSEQFLSMWVSWYEPTDADYAYTEIAAVPDGETYSPLHTVAISTATSATVYFPEYSAHDWFIRHFNTSGIPSEWEWYSFNPTVVRKLPTELIAAGAVSVWEKAIPGLSVTVPASSTDDVATVTSNHTSHATNVEIFGSFRNNSGGQRTVTITFRAGSTDLRSIANVTLADQQVWSDSFIHDSPSGESTVYKIRVTAGASSFVANERYISTKARKGK